MRRTEKRLLNLLPITLVAGLLAVPMIALGQTDVRPGTPLGNTVAPPAAAPVAPAPAAPAPAMRPGMMAPAPGAATAPAMPPPAIPPGMMAPAPGAAAVTPASGIVTLPGTVLHERPRMSQIIGARVYNDQNENVGTVDDILLRGIASASGAGGPIAVLQVGGFLGLGGRLVTVPLNDLRWNAERTHIVLRGATKEALQNRPAFDYSALPRG